MLEINLTSENFEKEVLETDKPVLVDFWANWCGPCKMLSPVISEIAEENIENLKVGKVNIDEQRELAAKYQITSIPTVMVFRNGNIINSLIGFHSKSELEKLISTK